MKITVFIPTIPRSFENINNLINVYNSGTVIPDEIVVNASMVDEKNCDKLNIEADNVKLFTHRYRLEAGVNRQMASYLSTGDLIIYQDDDDLPSNRRVEIIKYFFEKYDILCLNHSYVYNQEVPNLDDLKLKKIKHIDSKKIYEKYFPSGILEECINTTKAYGGGFDIPVCAGPVSIRREVLDIIQWKANREISLCVQRKGEDFDFCMEVLHEFNKSMIIDAQVYSYLK